MTGGVHSLLASLDVNFQGWKDNWDNRDYGSHEVCMRIRECVYLDFSIGRSVFATVGVWVLQGG